jgi:hypothetical protein
MGGWLSGMSGQKAGWPGCRNAGFIRQQHVQFAPLPDKSGVPHKRGIVAGDGMLL